MRIRKRHLVLAATIAGVWFATGRDVAEEDSATSSEAATSSARRSVAEFVASLPSPEQLKLRPMYVEVGELRLEGQAIDEAERPVGGALVTLNGTRTAVTEADGSFAFDGLAPAEYRITAEKGPLYVEDMVTVYDGADPASLEMKPGTTLVIHVLGQAGPIALANVSCDNRTAIADRTGTVKFRGVDLSSASIEIKAAGFASLHTSIETSDNPMATTERTFTLKQGSVVGGLVVDQDGKPVADASISIHAAAGTWRDSTDSDATGHFKFDGIGEGRLALTASSRIHIETPELVVPHDGAHDKLDLVVHVQLGLQITGIVVDDAGKPVPEAHVSASGGYAITDEHGRFEIKGLSPGSNELSANTDTKGSEITKLELAAGSHPDVRLVVVDSNIAGVVRNSKGEPVVDVTVYAREIHDRGSGYGRSDELGKFDLGGIVPGEYELVATRKHDRQGSPEHGVVVRSGTRKVSLVVADTGKVAGRVVLDGAPVDYFGIVLSDDPDGAAYGAPTPVRATDGTFVEDELRPGQVGLVIVGPSFMKKVVTHVVVREGQTTDLGDIVVGRGRSVTGRVTDDRGQPVAGALVSVSDGTSLERETSLRPLVGDTRTARADASGTYRIDGLPGDGKELKISATDEHGIAVPRTLAPEATAIDLVIAHTGAIDGIVTAPKGRSSIYARSSDGLSFHGSVDPAGEFHLDQLPAGTYLVELHGHLTIEPQLVTVTADATTHVTFEVPAMLVTLAIHYAPCKRMSLESVAPAGVESTWLDSSECAGDTAELANVAPGRYKACADYSSCGEITVAPAPAHQELTLVVPPPPPDPITVPEETPATPEEAPSTPAE